MPAKPKQTEPEKMRRIGLCLTDDLRRSLLALGMLPDGQEGGESPQVEPAGAPQVTGALRRYASLLANAAREIESALDRQEWNYLADVMNGSADLWDWTESPMPAKSLLAANAHDANELDGAGAKWFGDEEGEKRAKALVGKLSRMTEIQAEAVTAAIRWFWTHLEIDHQEDRWWTLAYRLPQRRAMDR